VHSVAEQDIANLIGFRALQFGAHPRSLDPNGLPFPVGIIPTQGDLLTGPHARAEKRTRASSTPAPACVLADDPGSPPFPSRVKGSGRCLSLFRLEMGVSGERSISPSSIAALNIARNGIRSLLMVRA
jgi:hypothetical protein